jgi:outer membrane protein insertion porin family
MTNRYSALSPMKNVFLPRMLFILACIFFMHIAGLSQTLIGEGLDYANPKKYRLAGLTVSGAVYTDVQAIKLFSGLVEGKEIMVPGDQITEAIRKLWKQRLFSDISVNVAEFRGDDVFLVIVVQESPRLDKFTFDGIRKSEADNLREKMDLRTGTVCNQNMKNNAEAVIVDYYTEKGFFNCKVNVKEEKSQLMQNGAILIFEIDRGDRVKIEEIIITGAGGVLVEKRTLPFGRMKTVPAISEKKIKRMLKNTKEVKWWRFWKQSKYMEKEFGEDQQKIIAKYNKVGFRNAKIISDSIYVINDERIGIQLNIEEDKKFYFRNITFVGNTKYRTSQLDSVLGIQKGDMYNLELLQSRLSYNPAGRDVSSLYTDDGYLSFNAQPVETLVEPDSIDIEVRMYEGKQYRVGRVLVIGNTKTNDHVIYREIRTRPGELFSRSDIIRTQRELAALGYFNPEAFDIQINQRNEEGLVDLTYVVEEKPNDQIQLSGGWGGGQVGSNRGRVVGSLSLSFSNFSMRNFFKKEAWSPLPTGDGQRLSISATSNGVFFQSYNLSFTEPWLGGKKPNSLSLSAWHSIQSNGVSKRQDGEIVNGFPLSRKDLKISGGAISFGKRLQKPDDYFVLQAGVSFQHYELNDYGVLFKFSNGRSNNLAGNVTLSRNSTSDPIYPKWGSQITFTTKATLPYTFLGSKLFGKEYDFANMTDQERYDWVEYYKFKFTAQWFTPLNKHKERNFVLNSKVGLGFLGTYNPQLGESPFERYYLGGVFLSGFLLDGREIVNLRGYDDLSLTAPSDVRAVNNVGAPVIAKYGFELRYPLSTNPQATIYALTFMEAGKTWEKLNQFDPFNVYRTAGMGLRIFLPMFGLLGFDYGWRLDDVPAAPNMARGQFHFSIGMNMGEL